MRQLDTVTLDDKARFWAGEWLRPDIKSPSGLVFVGGPSLVLQDLHNTTFKDEFDYMLAAVKEWMGVKALAEFEKAAKAKFGPRDDKVLAQLLKEKLAIDLDGNHIEGVVGTTSFGSRIVDKTQKIVSLRHHNDIVLPLNVYWPILAGELEERNAGRIRTEVGIGPGADPLPVHSIRGGATAPTISAALAIKMADIIDVEFNIGSTAANIRGRTGSQPADPDAAESGTLLFTLVMSDPAFGAAADDTPGGLITASSITDDSSADATGTLGYCRCAATGSGADDVVDGEAGTSGSDFNFNPT